jgi:Spy/CpxP family protein refolding chaperone
MKRILMGVLFVLAFSFIALCADDPLYPMMTFGGNTRAGQMGWKMCPMCENLAFDTVISYSDELSLTEQQLSKLKELRTSYRADVKKYKDILSKQETALDDVYKNPNYDCKDVLSRTIEIETTQTKIRSIYFNSLEEICGILTDKQKTIFCKLIK